MQDDSLVLYLSIIDLSPQAMIRRVAETGSEFHHKFLGKGCHKNRQQMYFYTHQN